MSTSGGAHATGAVSDKAIELFLGKMLRNGVILAAVVVLAGGVWYLSESGRTIENYKSFRGEPAALTHVTGIVHDAIGLQPLGLIQLGLLLLVATPVARVVFSVVGFAMERDWMYVVITLIVLTTLLFSLISPSLGAR